LPLAAFRTLRVTRPPSNGAPRVPGNPPPDRTKETLTMDAERLDEGILEKISARGGLRSYPAQSVIINEGDHADSLFIIISGRVKVFSTSEDGKEVVFDTHGAGEYVGEMSLDGGPRSASVMTLEATTCSFVSGENLREFIVEYPEFAKHLIYKLIDRARTATDTVKRLALLDVYGRVTRLLMEEAVQTNGELRVSLDLTQTEIANRVGASREMVNKILNELKRGGYIVKEEGSFVIRTKFPRKW
jgi:CRP/FNR family cyclic AMP-dependent transcriptional regulator